MTSVEKLSLEKLGELGLKKEDALAVFSHPFEIHNALTRTEAKQYVLSFEVDWNNFPLVSHYDASVMMDVDPYVFYNRGILVCSGGSFSNEVLNSLSRPLVIEGDLIVDGLFENNSMTIVTGDLICRSIMNESNYLLVLGDLKTTALVGLDEQFGTYIAGNAEIETAAFIWNHHMGVAGTFQCAVHRHDACDSTQDVIELLSTWGHPTSSTDIDWAAIKDGLEKLKMPS